jgi:hypothetical protein
MTSAVSTRTVRDVSLAQMPDVPRADVVATVALTESAVIIGCCKPRMRRRGGAWRGGAFCAVGGQRFGSLELTAGAGWVETFVGISTYAPYFLNKSSKA